MNKLISSSESLDIVGHREKYLKNTFDSLSGAEQDKDLYSGMKPFCVMLCQSFVLKCLLMRLMTYFQQARRAYLHNIMVV